MAISGIRPAQAQRSIMSPPLAKLPSVLPDAMTSPGVLSHDVTPGDVEVGGSSPGEGPRLEKTTTDTSPYYSMSTWRKWLIVFITSFATLSVTFSSTSLFPLTSEVAKTLQSTPTIIEIVNALVLFTMGCSTFIWGPIGRLVGRKPAYLTAAAIFILCTVGTGLASFAKEKDRLKVFITMRILSGFEGTFFHVAGQTWLADIFIPTERGTATGFFLAGSTFGPAFGPCIAGIMVTYTNWRSVLWLQAAMMGLALGLSVPFLPDIRRTNETVDHEEGSYAVHLLKEFNPTRIFKLMLYPNVLFTDLSCGFLSWNQYTLLAAVRDLLNPRFHLTTPLIAGLFYVAPGSGFLLGTLVGGKFSDMTVIKWIKIRGVRLPQDRLNSGMISFFFLVPVSALIYGWGLHYNVGGLALPIVTAFSCGTGLLMAFASVNTFCAECFPKQRTEVIATKYLVQYSSSAFGSAVIVPLIDSIGIGPASTIGVGLALIAGVLTLTTAKCGLRMQNWRERRL